jgi:hypothetical protein
LIEEMRRGTQQRFAPAPHRGPQDIETVADPGQERLVSNRDRDDIDQDTSAPESTESARVVVADTGSESVRASVAASLGLIVSVVGLCAALTGLLAPEGFALGVIGLLLSLAGLVASGRPAIAGRGLALLGLLLGLAAAAVALAALSGHFTWPNSKTDEVSRLHNFLVAHWSWLNRW